MTTSRVLRRELSHAPGEYDGHGLIPRNFVSIRTGRPSSQRTDVARGRTRVRTGAAAGSPAHPHDDEVLHVPRRATSRSSYSPGPPRRPRGAAQQLYEVGEFERGDEGTLATTIARSCRQRAIAEYRRGGTGGERRGSRVEPYNRPGRSNARHQRENLLLTPTVSPRGDRVGVSAR